MLADALHLNIGADDERAEILLDAFQGTLKFARENKFTVEAISVILAVLNRLHNYAKHTSFENTEKSAQFMRRLILTHACSRPPFAIEIFTPKLAQLALDHLHNTYFRFFYFLISIDSIPHQFLC